jgi:tetratricopeptide (TPR) repeat protein
MQAFQLVREAQEAERSGRLVDARNLYSRSLELDPNNVAAQDGRNRMTAHFDEAEKDSPRPSEAERRILGSSEARWEFNFAVEEADRALTLKRFAEARAARRRGWAAVERDRFFFPPADIEAFEAAAEKLDRRIADAEAATTRPASRPASHSR